jgi:NAD(P)-dependent dehydrogenase (short-subunit alcohol dehydrogenase family)
MNDGLLSGRVIAIAGAGGGLGPEVARSLAAAGATLALTDRSMEFLDGLVAELGLPPERVDAQAVDLLSSEATDAWAAGLTERFGQIDGLMHLVGGWRGGTPINESSEEDWAFLHDLLIRTVQHTSGAFHDALQASGRGRFVLISALQAAAPSSTNAAYGAAKAAAETWTLALADAFREGDNGATANIIVINALVTPQMREAEPEKAFKTFTDAGEIADTIVWMCSDAARKLNGRRILLAG